MDLKPASDVSTAPLTVLGLAGGFALARETGIRPLGGVLLGACGLLAGRTWLARTDPGTTSVLAVTYLGGFVGSHRLAKSIGAWPAVGVVTAASAAASWALCDARD
ncbi:MULTISPECIES: hypothetical protein [Arsenicicoccus]|uniref:Uncharacterized protein n=1 Tax=Arsenicicoccus bolidensis TaxID=229480 RepID=A0ABS9Q8N3_9MICO|nr:MULTISPECIES: hypothetical protein [Arsenicicoccus]MCG7323473.1 hypothetical protein [Arsenicicoccus bolidensis]